MAGHDWSSTRVVVCGAAQSQPKRDATIGAGPGRGCAVSMAPAGSGIRCLRQRGASPWICRAVDKRSSTGFGIVGGAGLRPREAMVRQACPPPLKNARRCRRVRRFHGLGSVAGRASSERAFFTAPPALSLSSLSLLFPDAAWLSANRWTSSFGCTRSTFRQPSLRTICRCGKEGPPIAAAPARWSVGLRGPKRKGPPTVGAGLRRACGVPIEQDRRRLAVPREARDHPFAASEHRVRTGLARRTERRRSTVGRSNGPGRHLRSSLIASAMIQPSPLVQQDSCTIQSSLASKR